ncbi:hypothetical protein MW887_010473 [Aspergillus wentii]|nr:hypothetical protein MW887_010473 [Aspergillus wentii]
MPGGALPPPRRTPGDAPPQLTGALAAHTAPAPILPHQLANSHPQQKWAGRTPNHFVSLCVRRSFTPNRFLPGRTWPPDVPLPGAPTPRGVPPHRHARAPNPSRPHPHLDKPTHRALPPRPSPPTNWRTPRTTTTAPRWAPPPPSSPGAGAGAAPGASPEHTTGGRERPVCLRPRARQRAPRSPGPGEGEIQSARPGRRPRVRLPHAVRSCPAAGSLQRSARGGHHPPARRAEPTPPRLAVPSVFLSHRSSDPNWAAIVRANVPGSESDSGGSPLCMRRSAALSHPSPTANWPTLLPTRSVEIRLSAQVPPPSPSRPTGQSPWSWKRASALAHPFRFPRTPLQAPGAAGPVDGEQQGYLTAYTTRLVTSVVCRGFIPARGDIAIRQPAPQGFSKGAVASLLRFLARRPIRIQLRRAGQHRRVPARILT